MVVNDGNVHVINYPNKVYMCVKIKQYKIKSIVNQSRHQSLSLSASLGWPGHIARAPSVS